MLHCFLPQPTVVTTVYLHRASGLNPPKQTGNCKMKDSYLGRLLIIAHISLGVFFLSFFTPCWILFHSPRCLRCSEMWEWQRQDAGVQGERKPWIQPENHLLQEIPQHRHLCWGLAHSCSLSRSTQTHRANGFPVYWQIYSRGLLWDSLLGETRLQTAESERSRSLVMNLRGGRSRSGLRGCVYLETSSSVCLTDLWQSGCPGKHCPLR